MTKTSIVGLNWHHAHDLTVPWLDDLRAHTPGDYEVIVVDQESGANEVAQMARYQDKMELIILPQATNTGFPEGCNIGARAATGDVIVWMNNDVRIDGDWLTPILYALLQDPKRIVGAQLIERAGWNELEVQGRVEQHPYLMGWLLAFNRAALTDIGYMDPVFGTGSMEDVDWCWRAVRAGYTLHPIWPLPLRHLHGKTVCDGRLDTMKTTWANKSIWDAKVRKAAENAD